METKEPFDYSDLLPFSFKKDDVPESRIKAHWLKILKKISEMEAAAKKKDQDN